MGLIVSKNNGFSLVEMMIAMVIIMISMLALLTSVITTTQQNMLTEQRNTAIRLTNQTAEALFALPVTDNLITDGTHTVIDDAARGKGIPSPVQSVRGYQKSYTISWDVAPRSANVKQITITIGYANRDRQFSNSAVVFKHKTI